MYDCHISSGSIKASVSAINKQLARLTSRKLDKDALEALLATKVDRRDIDRIAAQLVDSGPRDSRFVVAST